MPSQVQEDLRRRVVRAVTQGMKQTEAARILGVARGTINRWVQAFEQGSASSESPPPRTATPARLATHQAATTCG